MAALTWNCSVQQRKTSYMLKLPGVSVKQSSEWMLPRQSSSEPPLRCWRRNPFSCWRLRSLQESWSSRIHAVWTQTTQPQWRMKVGFDPVKHVTPAQTAPVKRPRLHTDPQCFLTRANPSVAPCWVQTDRHRTHRYTSESSEPLPLLPLCQGHPILFSECWSVTRGRVPAWRLHWGHVSAAAARRIRVTPTPSSSSHGLYPTSWRIRSETEHV